MQVKPAWAPGTPAAPPAGIPPPLRVSRLRRVVSLGRLWPAGGYSAAPCWFWDRDDHPGWSPLPWVGIALALAVPIGTYASVDLCPADDHSFGCAAGVFLAIAPAMHLGGWAAVLAVANVVTGGLKAGCWWHTAHACMLVALSLAMAAQVAHMGWYPLVEVPYTLLYGALTLAQGWFMFERGRRPSGRAFLAMGVTYSSMALLSFALTCGFLVASAFVPAAGRMWLNLGFNAAIWATKRAANADASMYNSAFGLLTSELWIDGVGTCSLVASLGLLGDWEFGVYLGISLAAALAGLWLPRAADRWAPQLARGPATLRRRRAAVSLLLDCIVQSACAVAVLLMSVAYERHAYFAIANLGAAALRRLRLFAALWAAAFAALGLAFARRHPPSARDLAALMNEYPEVFCSALCAAINTYSMMTMEHMQVTWYAFSDGYS